MLPAAIRSRFAPLTPRAADGVAAARPDAERCVTCGRPAGTPFCPHCGERRAADHAYTIGAVVADVWDHVTPADGKALRSAWTLVRRPGALTAAYMRGSRQPYLSPLRLFLFVNLVYFAAAGPLHQDVFSTHIKVLAREGFYAATVRGMVKRRIAERRTTPEEYVRRFDATIDTQSRSLVVAMVPAFAALAALVHARRRRPALQHLAFGFHVVATMLVVLMVAGTAVWYALAAAARWGVLDLGEFGADQAGGVAVLLLLWAWTAVGFRTAYGDGRWGAALRAAVVAGSYPLVLTLYRALLFFTAFWAT